MGDIPETGAELWASMERAMVEISIEALGRLAISDAGVNEGEPSLNRRFYQTFTRINYERANSGRSFLRQPPIPEAQVAPRMTDETAQGFESKRPDFQLAYCDFGTQSEDEWARYLVIECKRLRTSTRSWDFCEKYVEEGIVRFQDPQHSYGKDTPSGLMIGYIQDHDHAWARTQVNSHLRGRGIPEVVDLRPHGVDVRVAFTEHTFHRPFASMEFQLSHYWVNMQL